MTTSQYYVAPGTPCDMCKAPLTATEAERNALENEQQDGNSFLCDKCAPGFISDIRERREYIVNLSDDSGGDDQRTIIVSAGTEAEQDAEAEKRAEEIATEWAEDGEWGDRGALIVVRYSLEDDDSTWAEKRVEVEIEPNHEVLIRAAMGDEGCGTDSDDHDWTREGEGGLSENPGVWSLGGTTLQYNSHCSACGLRQRYTDYGPQRNPGQANEVEYFAPEEVQHG